MKATEHVFNNVQNIFPLVHCDAIVLGVYCIFRFACMVSDVCLCMFVYVSMCSIVHCFYTIEARCFRCSIVIFFFFFINKWRKKVVYGKHATSNGDFVCHFLKLQFPFPCGVDVVVVAFFPS